MSLLQDPFGIHAQALTLRSMRSTVLAANIANADTPNYKARDIDFKSLLSGNSVGELRMSDRDHIQSAYGEQGGDLLYRIPTNPSLDGNTVEIDTEQGMYADNAMRYQATLTFLNSRIKGIKTALRGE